MPVCLFNLGGHDNCRVSPQSVNLAEFLSFSAYSLFLPHLHSCKVLLLLLLSHTFLQHYLEEEQNQQDQCLEYSNFQYLKSYSQQKKSPDLSTHGLKAAAIMDHNIPFLLLPILL